MKITVRYDEITQSITTKGYQTIIEELKELKYRKFYQSQYRLNLRGGAIWLP